MDKGIYDISQLDFPEIYNFMHVISQHNLLQQNILQLLHFFN